MTSPGPPRLHSAAGMNRGVRALLCLLPIMLMGPTVYAIGASSHTFAPANLSDPYGGTGSRFRVSLPQAVPTSNPSGFTSSSYQQRILPTLTNATSRTPTELSLNDGFCFFGSGRCGQLSYHGGVVMHNASIVIILWAGCGSKGCLSCSTGYFDNSTIDPGASNPNDCTYGSLQLNYFRDFCAAGNPILKIMNQYADRSGALGSCSVYGDSWYYDYNKFPANPLSDADIQTEALAVLKGMNISASTNTAIFIFTPYGISSCVAANNCFPTGSFCAYHSWFWAGTPYLSAQVVYASMPDGGWAGRNCGLGGLSPNHDPYADLEVSPLSHEADEMFTDPTPSYIYGDGWYYDGYLEIADECAYDFVGTQPGDGSNIHLGSPGSVGDPYRVQSEWSNANGGCTFDLKGPPTIFQETIYPDASTGTTASSQRFQIRYQQAGETGAYSSINSTCCGVSTDFYSTLGTFTTTIPVVDSTERWCFDSSCSNQTSYVAGPTFLGFYYFDLLLQSAAYQVDGGGSVLAPTLSYNTAPSSATQGDNTVTSNLILANSPQEFWPLRGSLIVAPSTLGGATDERWATRQALWRATNPDLVPSPLVYYHEYSFTLSYSIAGGGTPGVPVLKFFQLGSAQETFLGRNPAQYWLDSGTPYNATDPLLGSTPTEGWFAKSPSGVVNGSSVLDFAYYHQYYVGASYRVVGGGTPVPPSIQVKIMGTPSSYQMGTTPTSMWIDADSWSAPAAIGDSPTERWGSPGTTNGTVSSDSPIIIVYYHQFRFAVGYLISDISGAAAPTLGSQSFGKTFAVSIGEPTTSYWLDNGANWSISHLLNGSGTLERWITNSPTSGTVTASSTALIEYLHEYYVTVSTGQSAGGQLTPTGWYNATISLQLSANANDGWLFENWDGKGNGAYSGSALSPTVTVLSPIVENATFYPALVLVNTGGGQISYQWGTTQGSAVSEATLYVPVGTKVTLTATPASPFFVFGGYEGAVSSGATGLSILVTGPTTITTSFGPSYVLLGSLFGGVGLVGAGLIFLLRRKKTG